MHMEAYWQYVAFPIVVLLLLPQDPMGLANADNAFTLYYVKFRAAAPKVRVSIIIASFSK